MIDLRVLGPNRPSTFKKVFSDVPGAIYGCLKVRQIVGETFRWRATFYFDQWLQSTYGWFLLWLQNASRVNLGQNEHYFGIALVECFAAR